MAVAHAPSAGDDSKGRQMDGQPRRPVSVSDVIGTSAPIPGAAAQATGDASGAEAHKILARTLRREGRFEAAAVAAARYRSTRLAEAR